MPGPAPRNSAWRCNSLRKLVTPSGFAHLAFGARLFERVAAAVGGFELQHPGGQAAVDDLPNRGMRGLHGRELRLTPGQVAGIAEAELGAAGQERQIGGLAGGVKTH